MDQPDIQDSPGAVFDLAQALENAMGELEILAELAEIFCEFSPTYLQQIAEAIADRDGPALRQAAHTLKGSLSPFCAAAAFQAALRMEELGKSGDFARADEAARDLEREVDRLRTALQDVLLGAGG